MLFLESLPSTPLNGSSRKKLAHDVYQLTIKHCEEIFWLLVPNKNLGPKFYLFSTISQLTGNLEGQYLRRGTQHRQSKNGVENYEGFPTSSQTFMNLGPLTAKILRFSSLPGFAHTTNANNHWIPHVIKLPTSSAWRRRPSRWPVLRRADISSLVAEIKTSYTLRHPDLTVFSYTCLNMQ